MYSYCFAKYWGNTWAQRPSAKVFWSRITLAVSSTEFCQCKFDEGDIREGLGGGCGYAAMISLL